jgi:stage V sporulation protein S
MNLLRVSANPNPNSVAGALAGHIRYQGAVEIQAIGAVALNQSPASTCSKNLLISSSKM